VDPLNHLLTEITALMETHGVIQAGLQEKVLFIHIHPIVGNPGLETKDIQGLDTNPADGEGLAGVFDPREYFRQFVGVQEEIEAVLAGVRRADHPDLCLSYQNGTMTEPLRGEFPGTQDPAENEPGLGALEREGSVAAREVVDFHVFGNEIMMEMRQDLGSPKFP
jgi:hypothetical protein